MDDGSTDATPDIVASYGDRVRSFASPRAGDLRQRERRDRAAPASSSASSTPTTSTCPTRRARGRMAAGAPEAGAVFCSDVFVDADGREFGRLGSRPRCRGERALVPGRPQRAASAQERFLRCPTALVRADVYRELGVYRDEFKNTSDLEMWLRIARRYPSACSRSSPALPSRARKLVGALPPPSHRPRAVLPDPRSRARRAGSRACADPGARRLRGAPRERHAHARRERLRPR